MCNYETNLSKTLIRNYELHLTMFLVLYRSVDKKVSTGKVIKSSDDVFRSSDEKLAAPNPIYASAITTGSKSTGRDIAVNNPMYQSAPSGNKRMLSYHEYESIHIDNLIAKHSAS